MIEFKITPYLCSFNERLSNCLWQLDHNNFYHIEHNPKFKREPSYFVYNRNYPDRPGYETQVIFSVGYLGEPYIKYFHIDVVKQPYWCGKVVFNDFTEELDIEDFKPWEYQNEVEGSKKSGWKIVTDLRYLFRVEIDLWNEN